MIKHCMRTGVIALTLALLAYRPVLAAESFKVASLGHSFGFLQVDIAEAQGWFKSEGRPIEIVQFKTGKDAATALQSGAVHAAILGVEHCIVGAQQGTPMRQVMVLNRLPGWSLVVDKKHADKVKTVADLKGMKIGVTSPGSATHVVLAYLFTRHGLPADGFTPVRSGGATLPDILKQGGIDAGMAVEPFVTALADSGDAYTLVDLRTEKSVREQFGSAYPMTSLVVRQDVIDDDPETVQRVTTALVKACRWLQTATPEDVTKLLPVDYVPEPDLWAKSFANSREVFSPDGAIDPEGIKTVIAAQIAFGTLKSVAEVQIESLYTIRFLEAQPVVVPSASPSQAKVPAPKAEETSRRWILAGLAVVLVIVLVSISKAGSKKGQIK